MNLVREKRQQYVEQRKASRFPSSPSNHRRSSQRTQDGFDIHEWLNDETDEAHTKTHKSDLYIHRATFSTEDIESIPFQSKSTVRSNLQTAGKTIKQPRRTPFRSRMGTMKRIQFVVPSNRKMQHKNKEEACKHHAVQTMDAQKLHKLLQDNLLVKPNSNAPDELKRNIAKSVF